ncbi:MAG: hypothetical protein M1820_006500 [Bogoriella megaspora]|nr:MAG: hypothetical protein M1820_006500 [Bogoriella megaspora]
MHFHGFLCMLFAAFAVRLVNAIDNISCPSSIAAGSSTTVTYTNEGSDKYNVYLAATVPGYSQGLSCYLTKSTTLPSSGFTINIPSSVGPSGNGYSIAFAAGSTPSYSTSFELTGGTGGITEYENHLNGLPLWDASQLPCTAYDCVRGCAQANYPADMSDSTAYASMNACIEACPGVTGSAPVSEPPQATSNSNSDSASPSTAGAAAQSVTTTSSLDPSESAGVGGTEATTRATSTGDKAASSSVSANPTISASAAATTVQAANGSGRRYAITVSGGVLSVIAGVVTGAAAILM